MLAKLLAAMVFHSFGTDRFKNCDIVGVLSLSLLGAFAWFFALDKGASASYMV